MENKGQNNSPKIYVACLAAYNSGQLHGEWIAADQETQEIYADIKSMLNKSPEPFAEEWAVHDYEGFGTISLSEWPDIERVSPIMPEPTTTISKPAVPRNSAKKRFISVMLRSPF